MVSGKKILSLKDLYIGEAAEVVFLDSRENQDKRLRDMGLREGVIIELVSYDSLINKKAVLKINETILALGIELIENIRVRPIKPWYNFYREKAFHDTLTGCLNRNAAFLILAAEYEKAMSNKIPLSVILIDIDDFKKINDTHGHTFGDYVLQQLGGLLRKNLRRTDMVFRWGGEEFLIVMRGLTVGESYIVAERLKDSVYFIELPDCGKGFLKISAGVDGVPPYVNLDELLERVDKALYAAKSRGKNQVCTFFWRKYSEAM